MTTRQILLTILNALSTFVGIVIGLHTTFLLLGANQSTPIVAWINNVSATFTYPFRGLFADIQLASGSLIDITAIIALVAYAILFSILYKLIYYLTHNEIVTEVQSHI